MPPRTARSPLPCSSSRPAGCGGPDDGAATDLRRAIERLVAAHRDAVAITAMRKIVEKGVMLGGAVVPERYRARLPLEAAVEFRRLDMAIEHFQKRVAFVLAQLREAQGEAAVDEQRLPARHRMGAHHGVLGVGELDVVAVLGLDPVIVR